MSVSELSMLSLSLSLSLYVQLLSPVTLAWMKYLYTNIYCFFVRKAFDSLLASWVETLNHGHFLYGEVKDSPISSSARDANVVIVISLVE